MGSNRRYPEHADRLADERELRAARKHGPLRTLTRDQLALHNRVVSIAPDSMILRGRAWLTFGDTDVQAPVRVRRWTDDAVGVEVDIDGEIQRCWVWRGACNSTDPT